MEKKIILFILVLLALPIIHADVASDSIKSQVGQNSVYIPYSAAQNMNPRDILFKAIKENPQVRNEVIKSMLVICLFMLITVIDIILRGFAMWRAAKKNSKGWFWVLLIVTTLCILPLLYLIFSKKPEKEHKKK